MTTRYKQLQPEERVTLASLRQQGHSLRSIAKTLGRSASSLSREVARNGSASGYASRPAEQAASRRRTQATRVRHQRVQVIDFAKLARNLATTAGSFGRIYSPPPPSQPSGGRYALRVEVEDPLVSC